MVSDNPEGAENQQERLVHPGWVTGFVDGEGCFSIGFIRQDGDEGRSAYKTGYQVTHEFVVTQGASSVDCLHALRAFSVLDKFSPIGGTTITGSTCIAT